MNVNYLISVPSGVAAFDGVKKLLAHAMAFPVEEGKSGAVDVPNLFCGCDPEEHPLGSGGGTVHLLHECYTEEQRRAPPAMRKSFLSWLRLGDSDGRVIVHAGGLSRRLPAYATLGKALLPLPPCHWHRGSQLTRALLSTQMPLYRALIASAPSNLRTLVACGDICVYVKGAVPSLAQFTDTDVLCLGVRTDAQVLQNHGVFFMSRRKPFDLEFMLQKPSLAEVRRCATEGDRSFLLDVGLWVLSDRAVEVLARRCLGAALDDGAVNGEGLDGQRHTAVRNPCDLYSEFGAALGSNCARADPEVTALKASVLEIADAEFLHYGTNRQLISSSRTLQACESPTPSWSWSAPFDGILVRERCENGSSPEDLTAVEAHSASDTANSAATELDFTAGDALPLLATPSSVLVHNAVVLAPLDGSAAAATAPAGMPKRPVAHLWVESSWIGARWTLRDGHVLTGVPQNNWELDLPLGTCVSVVPVVRGRVRDGAADGDTPYAARPYHIDDAFRGDVRSATTVFMGVSLHEWLTSRGLAVDDLYPVHADVSKPLDIYSAALFPVCATTDQLGDFLYLATLPVSVAGDASAVDARRLAAGQAVWHTQPRVSAMDLLHVTDIPTQLRNSEYYERRMLTLTVALVASSAEEVTDELGWSLPSTPAGTAAARPAGLTARSSVLSAPMVSLLQQQFFLLDLNVVAQRMVELGVGLPVTSGVTAHRRTARKRRRSSAADVGDAAGAAAVEGEDGNGVVSPVSWAHIFTSDSGLGGAGANSPPCSVSPHLVAAHYHIFVRRLAELQLAAIRAAGPTMGAEEKAKRLALLHASSVEAAEELVERHDAAAFAELRTAIMDSYPSERNTPRLGVQLDQIIWGRSPIRMDLAGAWTDTPPYTLLNGGCVINVAVELNGQPPVQVYVRVRRDDPTIVVHSIDSGARTVLRSYDDIRSYATMLNPFSIPKAALALSGFLPEFCTTAYASLQDQLKADFGGHGLEISLLVAIPTGSGLGTSSIVSGVVMRSLAEFCQLRWDEHAVCRRVLLVEQMLTAGGGWQDQYGGLFEGLKLVQSVPGLPATPTVRWMPTGIFTDPRFASCHLLYYTGITRMAKGILAEVVRDVFLNNSAKLQLLHEMGGPQTAAMYDKITTMDYKGYARLVHRTWEQKKRLDDGVCNPQVQAIVDVVEPYVWGQLLPGAGGGGYLYMCAKDETCARRIRELLTANPPNPYARFVEMSVSTTGIQISRS
ncbi:putative fucose kinase [Leptomonas pyrrhocoris]|uniref:Putative fucose kinase n=1 Tax=Leptomonas pyrrhocoris TaxID=157538 RepID=A0A0M9FX80_LEPPY|nr:putative fucose kinase [Leptomonas pyrrhocoris]XP_015656262.1 putative fucose kinase [Leptomonas pyrrhocoris]XP_015656263.1 putative fucose kinase [Leptomonas pyrrhocoris]KPA77822.1 putative fucose kinase [Leptomonas pyrrhocoris]KPA77823.1 putative fucose kinase [Leptomonas pyrrhocoris]KPA77824.1 putative fucose kinase [Leptomonas pyrrhocoris]|eukprot:XP_015656261.1 putative fucose kinase [Leptomonas pyrrhocoris]